MSVTEKSSTTPVSLIFYKNRDTGKITFCHLNKLESKEAAETKAAEYNANPKNYCTVSVVECDEFMYYLFKKLTEKISFSKETVDEIIKDLDSAILCLQKLKLEDE